ncbi:hypothetical protein C3L33_16931, partial [Rhododendron williamsianum]
MRGSRDQRDSLVLGRVIGDVLDHFERSVNLRITYDASSSGGSSSSNGREVTIGGQELMCYESPRPSVGIHRFVFVLFRQLGRETVFAPRWRQNFNTREFAELYNLGDPVAATYFNCQRETGSGGRRRP